MSDNLYDVGDLVRCTGLLEDTEGTDIDPSGAVTFKVRAPDDTITTYVYGTDAELIKSATGIYYADVDVTAPGLWYYRFASTGMGQAAAQNRFRVREGEF